MAEFATVGEIPTCEQIAQALGVSMRKFVRLSVMITASETISIVEPRE